MPNGHGSLSLCSMVLIILNGCGHFRPLSLEISDYPKSRIVNATSLCCLGNNQKWGIYLRYLSLWPWSEDFPLSQIFLWFFFCKIMSGNVVLIFPFERFLKWLLDVSNRGRKTSHNCTGLVRFKLTRGGDGSTCYMAFRHGLIGRHGLVTMSGREFWSVNESKFYPPMIDWAWAQALRMDSFGQVVMCS
jgi:hypothetical protein